jgi:hypothetical protein
MMPGWNEPSAAYYRELEQQQRALAETVSCDATREIHLEFAERYKKLAEQLEAAGSLAEGKASGI